MKVRSPAWYSLAALAWLLTLAALVALWVTLPRGDSTGAHWLSPPYPVSIDESGELTIDGRIGTHGERYTLLIEREIREQALSPADGSLFSKFRAPFQIVQAQVKLYDESERRIDSGTIAERRARWSELRRKQREEGGLHLKDDELPVPKRKLHYFAASIDEGFRDYWAYADQSMHDTVVVIRWRAAAMYLLFVALGAVELVLTPVLILSIAVGTRARRQRSAQ